MLRKWYLADRSEYEDTAGDEERIDAEERLLINDIPERRMNADPPDDRSPKGPGLFALDAVVNDDEQLNGRGCCTGGS